MLKKHSWLRLVLSGGVLPALVVMPSTQSSAQVPLPEIAVHVQIDSVPFFDYWSDSVGSGVRENILAHVHGECSTRFGFVDWVANRPGSETVGIDYGLRVRVLGEKENFGRTISMMTDIGYQGTWHPLTDVDPQVLYRAYGDRPSHDPAAFTDSVTATFSNLMKQESFRASLLASFLSKVPLAENLIVKDNLRLIKLLLPWYEMRLDTGSVFLVRFKSAGGFGDAVPGEMQLRSSYPSDEDEAIYCEVCLLKHGGVYHVRECDWPDQLALILGSILEENACSELRVYMQNYVQTHSTPLVGGLPY